MVEILVIPLLVFLLVMNFLALIAFAADKRRAVVRGRRMPERHLLMISLFGGSIGAKLGQRLFRHKTRKQPFASLLNAIALVHVSGLAAVFWYATRTQA